MSTIPPLGGVDCDGFDVRIEEHEGRKTVALLFPLPDGSKLRLTLRTREQLAQLALAMHDAADVAWSRPRWRATLEEAEREILKLGRWVRLDLPNGWGFVLVLASLGTEGYTTYLSSLNRGDATKMLAAMVDKIRAGEEI